MDYSHFEKPDLGYRYEFTLDEPDAAHHCVEAHGFAIIKKVLSDEMVQELQESVKKILDPDGTLGEGNSFTHSSFIEQSPAMWNLLDNEPYLRAQRTLCQSQDLSILRSAAILRNPGSAPLAWHSDFCGFSNGPRTFSGDVLNRGPWPSGLWFYITGSNPEHGGLALIEDSHLQGLDPSRWFPIHAGSTILSQERGPIQKGTSVSTCPAWYPSSPILSTRSYSLPAPTTPPSPIAQIASGSPALSSTARVTSK